jgi:uncharacterized protein YceK
MVRLVLLLIVLGLLSGCASETLDIAHDKHEPVAGEATPAPQSGPNGSWAW